MQNLDTCIRMCTIIFNRLRKPDSAHEKVLYLKSRWFALSMPDELHQKCLKTELIGRMLMAVTPVAGKTKGRIKGRTSTTHVQFNRR